MSGRGAAWLAHLLWEQRVVSSNLAAPTIYLYHLSVKPPQRFFRKEKRGPIVLLLNSISNV